MSARRLHVQAERLEGIAQKRLERSLKLPENTSYREDVASLDSVTEDKSG